MLITKGLMGSKTHLTIINVTGATTEVEAICERCNTESILKLNSDGLNRWINGDYIQIAFPELDVDTRELLISGTCGACWNEFFVDLEEE